MSKLRVGKGKRLTIQESFNLLIKRIESLEEEVMDLRTRLNVPDDGIRCGTVSAT